MSEGLWPRTVIVLDRDGTIVVDQGYLNDPAGLTFLPGAQDGLRAMHRYGYRLVVITNQSGIGRGLQSLDRLEKMNDRLREMVADAGASLEGIYFCPHVPDDHCDCRKPAQGLLLRAAAELGFALSSVVVVGDRDSDIELGHRAGAPAILISSTPPETARPSQPDIVVADLLQAAQAIYRNNSAVSYRPLPGRS